MMMLSPIKPAFDRTALPESIRRNLTLQKQFARRNIAVRGSIGNRKMPIIAEVVIYAV